LEHWLVDLSSNDNHSRLSPPSSPSRLLATGYVNATLEYHEYVPFFFDSETFNLELGHPDKLPEMPREGKLVACH
jgi:hypothetical protein